MRGVCVLAWTLACVSAARPCDRAVLHERSGRLLHARWSALSAGRASRAVSLPAPLRARIAELVREDAPGMVTYRVALVCQLLARAARPALDPRCIQMSWSGAPQAARFDARSLCAAVLAPFDAARLGALGARRDTYTNAPVKHRAAWVAAAHRRNAAVDREICLLLQRIRDGGVCPHACLDAALEGWLARHRALVRGRAERRVGGARELSRGELMRLTGRLLADDRGGQRAQALVGAVFLAGEAAGRYRDVRVAHHNAADAATGHGADVRALDADGTVVGVEVRGRGRVADRAAVLEAAAKAAAAGIDELAVLVMGPYDPAVADEVEERVWREHAVSVSVAGLRSWLADALRRPNVRRGYLDALGLMLATSPDALAELAAAAA